MLFDRNNKPIIFNLDDFSEQIMTPSLWKNIHELKRIIPDLKITMFTVPLLCSEDWLKNIKKNYKWIEMHYHGSNHIDRNEWFKKTEINLPFEDKDYFYKGFKAPWWRMDQQTANVLDNKGFLISACAMNFDVTGRKVYRFNIGTEIMYNTAYENSNFNSLHSHVQHQGGNDGLPDAFDKIANILYKWNKKNHFIFVSELFKCG